MAEAGGLDRLLLWIWCIACFLATMGLFLYLPMSTFPRLEELSENPEPLTVLFGSSVLVTVAILLGCERRPAFTAALQKPLLVGTVAAILGFTSYGTYVYAFSQTLAVAEAAPKVGDMAPDFEVVDPEGRTFSLSAHRGAPILLVFYRGQW